MLLRIVRTEDAISGTGEIVRDVLAVEITVGGCTFSVSVNERESALDVRAVSGFGATLAIEPVASNAIRVRGE